MYGSSDKTCFGKASFFKLNTKTTTPMSAVSGRSFSTVLSAYLLPFTVANDISTYKIVSRPLVICTSKIRSYKWYIFSAFGQCTSKMRAYKWDIILAFGHCALKIRPYKWGIISAFGHYTSEIERERVSWCFTPNQPVRLYQADREIDWLNFISQRWRY